MSTPLIALVRVICQYIPSTPCGQSNLPPPGTVIHSSVLDVR